MSRTTLWTRLSRIAAPSQRRTANRFARRPAAGGLEMLEDRKLMTVTELADAALLVGHVHSGTHLYINFDGGAAPTDFSGKNFVTIRPFETEAGDGALNRNRDIQDILFQVAEVYSPFDVQVQQIYGSGEYSTDSGNTTVFVGGNAANSSISLGGNGLTDFTFSKDVRAFTPGAFDDGQTPGHEINTHPYDIAFVDPVGGSTKYAANIVQSYATETQSGDPTRANIFDIRRSIAHEAGHTFGLAHVRSDGVADANTPKDAAGKFVLNNGTVNDVQAYGAQNVFFANQNLALTKANNTPSGIVFNETLPAYHDAAANQNVTLVTENSFQTLSRVLGFRSQNEAYPIVADASTVDPILQTRRVDASNLTGLNGFLGRNGDYQVVRYTAAASAVGLGYDRISIHAVFGNLQPEILVYDASGTTLITVVNSSGGVATLTNLKAGPTYTLAIGAVGDTTGAYYATIEHRSPFSQSATVNGSASQAYVTGAGTATTTINGSASQAYVVGAGTSTTTTTVLTKVPVLVTVPQPDPQPDTTGTTLDLAYVYRPRALAQVQVINDYLVVAPTDLTPPAPDATVVVDPSLVVDATATTTVASDLTVVVDTTVANAATPAPVDPALALINDAPVAGSTSDRVAMATDAALADLTAPAPAIVNDGGTGLLFEYPTVASILSNV